MIDRPPRPPVRPPRSADSSGSQQADVLLSLFEIAAATASAEDLDRLLEAIADRLGRLFPVDRADAAFEEDGYLQVVTIRPRPAERGPGLAARRPADRSHHLGWVVTEGRALWRNDFEGEIRFRESLPRRGMRSDMAIPLRSRGRVTGAFRVAARKAHAYDPEEFDLLQRLADVVAVAVENQRLLQVTRRMAEVDGLTGVTNHRHFAVLLEREAERSRSLGQSLALLMVDVDHFKQVNDTWGHPAGDAVLRHIAQRLAQRLRRSDVVARYGGEEFAVLLPGSTAAAAATLAEQLRSEIERHPAAAPPPAPAIEVTASIGVAALPEHALGEAALLEAADRALYRAKRSGRNRVVIASNEPAAS